MIYYPVIIPTLNRFQHFKECVESLSKCTHADKTELVIGLDYPPSDKYKEGWKLIKNFIPTITGFGKVTFFEHRTNLGASGNEIFLKNYVFEKYDAYIFSEDDNIFSPCFLDYMNKCLEKYKDDNQIFCICGCLEPNISKLLTHTNNTNSIVKIIGNMSAYGEGIWKKKELELQKKFPEDFRKYIFSSRVRILKLLKCPIKLNHNYYWLKNNPKLNCICDFTRNAWMVLNNQVNILPSISLVKNLGFDGSGLNCGNNIEEQKRMESMIISNDKTYEVIDHITKKEIKKISKLSYKPSNELEEKEKKDIFPIAVKYLIFGYTLNELWIIKKEILSKTKIYAFLKNIKKRVENE